jgi:hypothetical protein
MGIEFVQPRRPISRDAMKTVPQPIILTVVTNFHRRKNRTRTKLLRILRNTLVIERSPRLRSTVQPDVVKGEFRHGTNPPFAADSTMLFLPREALIDTAGTNPPSATDLTAPAADNSGCTSLRV